MGKSVIKRANIPKNFRNESEVQAAYEQVGHSSHNGPKSLSGYL